MEPSARRSFRVWQTYTRRLAVISVISMLLAWPLAQMNRPIDGPGDPFYVALAWQFLIWGAIDFLFAVNGFRGLWRTARLHVPEREAAIADQRDKILAALRFNRWLNAIWIAMAAALVAWGYWAWSASLVGHGVGMFVQAGALVVFDRAFARALRA